MTYKVSSGWEEKELQDIIICNPEEHIEKGSIVKQVNLDKLEPCHKFINGFEEVEYTGGGSKFRNCDVLFPKISSALTRKKTALVTILDPDEVGVGSNWYMVLRAVPQVTDPDFLYYLAITPWFRELALRALEGSSRSQYINLPVFLKSKFLTPPYEEQRSIAKSLSAIDLKIQKNNEVCQRLESILKRLFRTWFIDFNFPNDHNAPYKQNGGSFHDNGRGDIPDGWTEGCLSDLGEIVAGGTPSQKISANYTSEGGIPWITPKDLSQSKLKFIARGATNITQKGFDSSNATLLPTGSVLFSSRAPIGYIAIAANELTTNQGFRSIIPKEGIGSAYLYYLLLNKTEEITNMASGSTFQEISGAELKKLRVIIPDSRILELFQTKTDYLTRYQKNLEKENQLLIAIRDHLLPLVMSGEL